MTAYFKKYFGWVAFVVVVCCISFLVIGDFRVRQAISPSSDDNPIFYAKFYQDPQRYENDIIYEVMQFKTRASLMHWLTIILFNEFHINPEIVTGIFIFSQTALLCVAMYLLTLYLSGQHLYAWIATFFVFALHPWQWDLSINDLSLAVPYPAHLALPVMLLAVYALFNDRMLPAAGLLVIAGLIHPVLVLYIIPIIGLYLLFLTGLRNWRKLIVPYAALLVLVLICIAPGLSIKSSLESIVSIDRYMPTIRNTVHLSPWVARRGLWIEAIFNFSGLCLLLLLSLRYLRKSSLKYFLFVLSTIVVTIFMLPLQPIAVKLQIPTLIQLTPFRISRILMMIGLPSIILYLMYKSRSVRFITRFSSIVLVLFMVTYKTSMFWMLLVVLLVDEMLEYQISLAKSQPKIRLYRRGYYVTGGLLGIWLIVNLAIQQNVFAISEPRIFIAGASSPYLLLIIVAFVLAVLDYLPNNWQKINEKQLSSFVVPIVLIVFLLYFSIERAELIKTESTNDRNRDIYAAQIWANENTPTDAEFIIRRLPWRTYAERAAIEAAVNFKFIYTRDARLEAYNERVLDFYGLEDLYVNGPSWEVYFSTEDEYYRSLDEDAVLAFSQQFGGDYIVFEQPYPQLNFDIVFENSTVIIYRIPENTNFNG